MSENQDNNYVTGIKAWFMMMDPATGKNGTITPYQKEVYIQYKNAIINKIKYIRSQDDDIIIEMNKKLEVMENAIRIYNLTFLLLSVVLAIHLFGRELSNGEIYYTYSFPYLRTKIFDSQIILMNGVLLILTFVWYCIFVFFHDIMFEVNGLPYFVNGITMPCNLYYFIKFMLMYFKCIGFSMCLICINLYVKINILTLVVGFVAWLLSDIFENFAIVMNWSNYSLLPTFSYKLESKIFKIPYVNEIEYFYNNVTQVIDDSYSLLF